MLGSAPDLLRLLAVPVLGWAAWRDVRTRRVPNTTWLPLVALGAVALVVEAAGHLPPVAYTDRLYLLRVAVSVGGVVPLAYVLWRIGGFGGADAKALMAIAVVYPTFPTYYLPTLALPLERTTLGVFSMTVLTNTVLAGLAYPLALAAGNALRGDISPAMFLGCRVDVTDLSTAHGRLFETGEGFTRRGLDLDALRMYLRWRGTTLAALRAAPERHRDPASVGETRVPGDGAVHDGPRTDGGGDLDATAGTGTDASDDGRDAGPTGGDASGSGEAADPWAAERFLEAVEGDAYGTSPERLREGLALVSRRDEVWISPGIPFLVPMFAGLLVALTYGDVLFGVLVALGAV